MRHLNSFVRARAVERVRQKLLNNAFPRAQMSLIVLLTGGFGLLASFVMLQLGWSSMTLRYPMALGFSYLFFLFLIWLWLRTNAKDYLDAPDLSGLPSRQVSADAGSSMTSGDGGEFAGGGASASFDASGKMALEPVEAPLQSVGDALGAASDADDLSVPLLAVALALGLALASTYIVYMAPVLLAEVVVDGAFSYALFRYLQGHDPQHWLASTFRRTVLPFLVTGVFLAGMGAAMAVYAPGAKSVGQVLHYKGKALPAK